MASSSSSIHSRRRRDPPPTLCECEEPVIQQTAKTIDFPLRRFFGCVNYYKGSKCRTFYWIDDELPSEYYKKEVFKLIQKDKHQENRMKGVNGRIRDIERDFDLQKSTMEKHVLELQKELKETKASLMFYRKIVGFMFIILCLRCLGVV